MPELTIEFHPSRLWPDLPPDSLEHAETVLEFTGIATNLFQAKNPDVEVDWTICDGDHGDLFSLKPKASMEENLTVCRAMSEAMDDALEEMQRGEEP